jgi:ATP-binding protein involved in chromosome partitioning
MKTIVVASTKGGVGKTTVTVNIARKLALKYKVGILDGDLTSPSVCKILNAPFKNIKVGKDKIEPMKFWKFKIFSTAMLTANDDMPILFKGEKKRSTMAQFIKKINWGDLDYLVIDAAPGCSDELIEILNIYKDTIDGMVIVSTPSRLSVNSVRKLITLCNKKSINIASVVINMAYLSCYNCGSHIKMFGDWGTLDVAVRDFNIKKYYVLPLEPKVENRPFKIIEHFGWVYEVL